MECNFCHWEIYIFRQVKQRAYVLLFFLPIFFHPYFEIEEGKSTKGEGTWYVLNKFINQNQIVGMARFKSIYSFYNYYKYTSALNEINTNSQ